MIPVAFKLLATSIVFLLLGNVYALARGQDLPFLKAQGPTSALNGGPSAAAAGLPKTSQKGSFYDFEAKASFIFQHPYTGTSVSWQQANLTADFKSLHPPSRILMAASRSLTSSRARWCWSSTSRLRWVDCYQLHRWRGAACPSI